VSPSKPGRVIVYGGSRDGRFTGGLVLSGAPRAESPIAYAFNDEGRTTRAEAEAKRERKRRARLGET
jgi:hypothetical protein